MFDRDVRKWPLADIAAVPTNVRFGCKSHRYAAEARAAAGASRDTKSAKLSTKSAKNFFVLSSPILPCSSIRSGLNVT